ncbi:unnamed protein product, partial [Brachionus calyciflorus]
RLNQIISIQKRPLSTSSQVNDHFLKKTKKELEKKDTLKSSSRISFISDSSFNSLVSLNNNFSDESVYVEQRESYYDTDQSDDSIDSSEKASEIDSVKEKNDESLLQSEVELTSLQLAELSVHDHKIVKGSNASTFEYDPEIFFVYDSFSYAFFEETVRSLPKSIKKSYLFSFDLRLFKLSDVLADNNGAYRQYVTKTFYRSMIQNAFRRKTFIIRRKKDSSFDKLIVCYINPGDQMFELKCHGNARKISRPYVKKTETCLNNIKSSAIKAESLTLAYAHLISEASKS